MQTDKLGMLCIKNAHLPFCLKVIFMHVQCFLVRKFGGLFGGKCAVPHMESVHDKIIGYSNWFI